MGYVQLVTQCVTRPTGKVRPEPFQFVLYAARSKEAACTAQELGQEVCC